MMSSVLDSWDEKIPSDGRNTAVSCIRPEESKFHPFVTGPDRSGRVVDQVDCVLDLTTHSAWGVNPPTPNESV